jgi:GR25 family glycosyltransferase involved in LPS biosynthesis
MAPPVNSGDPMAPSANSGDPFDFFEAIYCINLDRRPDRWAHARAELERVGIADRVERVSACEGGTGIDACRRSHLEVARRAQARGLENVLVLEDDVVFSDLSRERLAAAIAEIRGLEWDLFFLGARPLARPQAWYPHLVRAPLVQTHAYAMHRRAFTRVHDAANPFDVWWAYHLRCYCVRPPVAEQLDDEMSDIEGKHDRKGEIQRRAWALFVEATYPTYLARHTILRARRAVGRSIVRAAGWFGVKVVFEHGRPRLVR